MRHLDTATRHAVDHTAHCLVGCGIGEVLGNAIGIYFGWANAVQTLLAVVLAFSFGYGLTYRSGRRSGMDKHEARATVLRTDTVSIISMEIIDNTLEYLIPGAINAGLTTWLFYWSEALSLAIAFVVTVPVNRYMIVRFGIMHGGHTTE